MSNWSSMYESTMAVWNRRDVPGSRGAAGEDRFAPEPGLDAVSCHVSHRAVKSDERYDRLSSLQDVSVYCDVADVTVDSEVKVRVGSKLVVDGRTLIVHAVQDVASQDEVLRLMSREVVG